MAGKGGRWKGKIYEKWNTIKLNYVAHDIHFQCFHVRLSRLIPNDQLDDLSFFTQFRTQVRLSIEMTAIVEWPAMFYYVTHNWEPLVKSVRVKAAGPRQSIQQTYTPYCAVHSNWLRLIERCASTRGAKTGLGFWNPCTRRITSIALYRMAAKHVESLFIYW